MDHDCFRDEGRQYAERLRDAGVGVRYTNYVGMPHGFLSMPRLCSAAPQALAEIASAVREVAQRRPESAGSTRSASS